MFAPSNSERMKGDIERVLAIAKSNPKNGFIAALAGMRDRKDRQHILERAGYPVLFIIGKDDLLIPLDKMSPQIVKPKHSEVLMLSGVGHMGFYEAKEKTLFAVERFMEETGKG
jgi:pimeloyl-ACP methyl ester carboxylesterase